MNLLSSESLTQGRKLPRFPRTFQFLMFSFEAKASFPTVLGSLTDRCARGLGSNGQIKWPCYMPVTQYRKAADTSLLSRG